MVIGGKDTPRRLNRTATPEYLSVPERTRSVMRLVVLAAAVLVAACGPREAVEGGGVGGTPRDLRGRVLAQPLAKPIVALTDTDGHPYDLSGETQGFLTLLFFGYTHCPDICPVHMANLAAVLKELPPSVTTRVKVIFVTTDPARDTPDRLRTWLDQFDRSFVGLTGDTAEVARAQAALLLPPSQVGPADSGGGYLVGHAAAVVAFTPDGLARAMYPFGIRQADWAHDIPKLLSPR
jgi:protein SCO1/2